METEDYRLAEEDDRDEEEAFWIFIMLVEVILPPDFFTSIVGAQIDQRVFQVLMQERMPDLCEHFENINVSLSFLAHQWLICLLGCGLPQNVSDTIWDIMFLKGHKVIF